MSKTLKILGTRGVPASHGGFETFAEYLALYLVSKGWDVTVYCQIDGTNKIYNDNWDGIKRVNIPVKGDSPLSTIIFDWKSTIHASKSKDLCLTLGYNTAVFASILRLKGVPNIMNMDGIEWKRKKWGLVAKLWFWLNDWAGCWLANNLVADHPEIKKHLLTRGVNEEKITTIAYGADKIDSANVNIITQYGLSPESYALLIARAEPENSILEIVKAWSKKPRGKKLVILGKYFSSYNYHKMVKAAASEEVIFLGAIYDKKIVSALRFYAWLYLHGHQVGGTNPSLVEALGANNPVLAHDNAYNKWVCGEAAFYFDSIETCASKIDALISNDDLILSLKKHSEKRFETAFRWHAILESYESLLSRAEFQLAKPNLEIM